ncbi:uncharacterized protein N7473_010594 [Penicillium subrubescens]|uniref:Ubiquitin-like domain-containing protein n=1 Tax=Penicillium subrubescens TaxID=1316194 RepID=A0A1Q5UD49_9EURO|nr:uncharacterized protein N7473_010594 [Penicillium subrubescens]KAJ5883708.1 hypothetical protein N7473_010594 [Penicillium subrubescens]OKP10379.1 hypothetical protein PENSUB_4226 [Penicillium subrubescens]
MGCCSSVPSHDDDPHPHEDSTITDDRTTQATRIASTSTSTTTQTSRRRVRRAPNLPLSEHYNEPVRLHVWYSKRRTWNRTDLDRERREFFETRVTGRPEVWAALSTAITLMRGGDLATAQSIVDAAGVTIPTGDLCEGCYDEQGVLYRLPQCIVSDPENMAQTTLSSANDITRDGGATQEEEDTEALSDGKLATDDASGDELIREDIERRRDEKGKTSERDLIRVQARLSDRGGPDLVLSIGKGQSVGFLARKIQQETGISNYQRVRIAYLGRMLKEHESLLDQGWQHGHVVNALIASRGSF